MSRRPYLQAPTSSVHATGLSRRKKSAHGISGKKIYFSGLGLPKRSSLHQLPLATVRCWVWAKQAFCVQERPSANQNAVRPIHLLA